MLRNSRNESKRALFTYIQKPVIAAQAAISGDPDLRQDDRLCPAVQLTAVDIKVKVRGRNSIKGAVGTNLINGGVDLSF